MKKSKIAASLIAVSLAATTLLTGCKPKENNSNSGNSGSGTSDSGTSNSGSGSGTSEPTSPGGVPTLPTVDFNPEPAKNLPFNLTYPEGTTIRMAVGYNNTSTGIRFDADTAGAGLDLPDGKHYNSGDLKPTWAALSEILKVNFVDKFTGAGGDSKEWAVWKDRLDELDICFGTATNLSEAGVAGKIVDLSKYLDQMPNFKAYLDANPIVRLSITSYSPDGKLGAIYFAPYFDGVNDIERMPLMRIDWVEKLLNGSGDFTAAESKTTATPVYTPYMPTSGSVTVEVVKNGTSDQKETVTKNYDAEGGGNIIKQMNDAGSMTGVEAVNMLRKYIDVTYNGYYGENRADLFIGQNAAWDADELVALLRCVVSNSKTLNGTDTIQGLFSREDAGNNRRVDMYKFAGTLFGARGLESRKDYLYVGNDNMMHDARQEVATYEALERMNMMAQEGLIAQSFMNKEDIKIQQELEQDLGFMHYDYNQTQTIYNETGALDTAKGERYRAVMVPVAKWYDDGTTTPKYFRFTESWRSVKSSGYGIPVSTESNTDVLNACLHLLDYPFSLDGQILMSYGPDAFIDVKDASVQMNTIDDMTKKYNTFDFNGDPMPMISAGTKDALWKLANGNYTNFARQYLGSTLHFVKSQAFEVQCTTEVGKEGAQILSNAIAAGTIFHPVLSTSVSNPWYISVPTVLPATAEEKQQLADMSELGDGGYFNTGSNGSHLYVNMIVSGYNAEGAPGKDAKSCADNVKNNWSGTAYLQIMNDDWNDILNF